MKRFLTWQKVLGILGVLILGGFASTVSDLVFKPVVLGLGDFLLDVATLGISSVRDGMYVEVAKGSYERAAVYVLLAWTAVVFGVTFFTAAIALIITRPGFLTRLRAEMKSAKETDEATTSKGRKLIYALITLNCLTAGFVTISSIRMIYVVRAANHLEQLQRVISPYTDADKRLQIQSSVAQIGSRKDYEAVVAQMIKIAEAHNLRIPTFDIN
ncbi:MULTISPECIES: hypothetical protein [unclassified Afipia]|uniref:hypothetical protein n=1 Tax=unclassified Afipia TaxID=2642050 RepID=UPI0012687C6E|nr:MULTISPECIES: hypothetical protein [unclassified Afipia]